jgi:hypothetical protein
MGNDQRKKNAIPTMVAGRKTIYGPHSGPMVGYAEVIREPFRTSSRGPETGFAEVKAQATFDKTSLPPSGLLGRALV